MFAPDLSSSNPLSVLDDIISDIEGQNNFLIESLPSAEDQKALKKASLNLVEEKQIERALLDLAQELKEIGKRTNAQELSGEIIYQAIEEYTAKEDKKIFKQIASIVLKKAIKNRLLSKPPFMPIEALIIAMMYYFSTMPNITKTDEDNSIHESLYLQLLEKPAVCAKPFDPELSAQNLVSEGNYSPIFLIKSVAEFFTKEDAIKSIEQASEAQVGLERFFFV